MHGRELSADTRAKVNTAFNLISDALSAVLEAQFALEKEKIYTRTLREIVGQLDTDADLLLDYADTWHAWLDDKEEEAVKAG